MNKIISKEQFSEKVFKFELEAPLIAQSRKAGHFVIVRVDEMGERMPLTIAGERHLPSSGRNCRDGQGEEFLFLQILWCS